MQEGAGSAGGAALAEQQAVVADLEQQLRQLKEDTTKTQDMLAQDVRTGRCWLAWCFVCAWLGASCVHGLQQGGAVATPDTVASMILVGRRVGDDEGGW